MKNFIRISNFSAVWTSCQENNELTYLQVENSFRIGTEFVLRADGSTILSSSHTKSFITQYYQLVILWATTFDYKDVEKF